MKTKFHWLALVLALVLPGFQTEVVAAQPPTTSPAAHLKSTTIDFSTHPGGDLEPKFYKKEGIVFTKGSFVGFIQGDNALVGPVAATLTPPVSSLSVQIAPGFQGTAEYTLKGFDPSQKLVSSVSVVVTQDDQDPATGPFGYFAMELGNLAEHIKYFTLENRFIRSTFPSNKVIEFGVSSITYSTPRHSPRE